jgi:coenzyme F420-reducing hydrogenase beta subunit
MRVNSRGELVPGLGGGCTECQLCLKVCPALEIGGPLRTEEFFGEGSAEGSSPIGNFAAAYVGCSDRHREKAASGGMATWTLEELFRKRKIDAAVCVAPSQGKTGFFQPVVVSRREDVFRCSGSRYYPVEFSAVLAHIREREGTYAVAGLPCVVTAIRKAQRIVPLLRKRIRYVFALACGHGVSKHFAGFLLAVLGLDEKNARNMDFRYSRRSVTSANFAFRAQRVNGHWSRPLFFRGVYGRLWGGRFFVPQACEFCDDLFSPLADATFMDAWLPEYVADVNGTSIVVVRQPELGKLLREGHEEGRCRLRPVAVEDIKRSQHGALSYKTVLLPLHVARAERDGLRIPRSFQRIPAPVGIREMLAKVKCGARTQVCARTFDEHGRARAFWVFVLTAWLRAQSLWRAMKRRLHRPREGGKLPKISLKVGGK